MGIFSAILDKLRSGSAHAAQPSSGSPAGSPQQSAQASQPQTTAAQPQAQQQPAQAGMQGSGQPALQNVDVDAVLTRLAGQKGGGNYRQSIVDLLKLLGLDSSLDARKELAQELGVNAGPHGSAEQNIALHQAVMRKLEENGGKVPDSMKH
jgi:hypothetical protein